METTLRQPQSGHLTMLQRVRRNRKELVFVACCVWIAVISVHDAVLVVVNHDVIEQYERNPVGRWLLERHGGEVWLFVMVKLAGTAAVCVVLVSLYRYRRALAMPVAAVLAGFQLLLLCYLHFR